VPKLPSLPALRLPRPPIGPDPLRRVHVPRDLEPITTRAPEQDPEAGGMSAAAVESIWEGVERLYRSGVHPAIQLCLRRRGEVVLDRAIGHAQGNGPGDPDDAERVLVTTETPFSIFSASKAITATVVHLLDERGLLHLNDRVAEYIPEYGRHGKDAITIEHLLTHKAGVPNLPGEALSLEHLDDREYLVRLLSDAKPSTRPGRLRAYHAVSGGFVIAEVVQRVTGRDIRHVLADEILDPLGFRWMNYGVAPEDVALVGRNYVTGLPVLPPISTMLTRALGVPVDEVVRMSNEPRALTAIVPSANVVTNANELSRFFELLRAGGIMDGIRILEERTIRRALSERSYLEVDLTLGAPVRMSAGFILGAEWISLYGPDTELAFGHLGFTNILGWADPERELSGALMTSGKPIVYPELYNLWALMRRIGIETPKTDRPMLSLRRGD
jgi:CubicO group peptidase (beta-lactamase class C family)